MMNNNVLDLHTEPLERRQMLAGNVTASFNAAGDLRVTGDNQNNDLTIELRFDNGFRFVGGGGTTINGEESVTLFRDDVRDLRINMRGGFDGVTVVNPLIGHRSFRNGIINSGTAGDTILIEGGTQNRIKFQGSLRVAVGPNAAIEGGTFNQQVTMKHVEVDRNLVVRGSSVGADNVHAAVTVHGRSVFNLGAGNDSLNVGQSGGLNPDPLDSATFNGTVSIKTGAGNDDVFLREVTAEASFTVTMGGGNKDQLWIETMTANGQFRANGGAGAEDQYVPPINFTVTDSIIRGFEDIT